MKFSRIGLYDIDFDINLQSHDKLLTETFSRCLWRKTVNYVHKAKSIKIDHRTVFGIDSGLAKERMTPRLLKHEGFSEIGEVLKKDIE